jgi:hypothetical protein
VVVVAGTAGVVTTAVEAGAATTAGAGLTVVLSLYSQAASEATQAAASKGRYFTAVSQAVVDSQRWHGPPGSLPARAGLPANLPVFRAGIV